MSIPHARSVLLASLAVVATILSGCAAEATPTPSETAPAPSPTSSDEATPAPTPVLDIECADLLPAGVGGGLLRERLGALEPVTGFLSSLPTMPYEYATVQTGGLECAASNGEPRLIGEGVNPAAVAVYVYAVPNAAEAFDGFRQAQPQLATPPADPNRIVSCTEGSFNECYLDLLVGDVWVAYTFSGVDPAQVAAGTDAPLIEDIADSAAAAVGGAARTDATWTAPADAVAITDDCAQFFSTDTVAQDLGLDEVHFGPYEDYGSAERAARVAAPALLCPWVDPFARAYGGHDTLAGGEWAYRQVEADGGVEGWTPLAVAGLADDDVAVSTCDVLPDRCVANLVVGRNWVQITVLLDPNGFDAAAAATELASLAESTVTAIRS